jgi:glycosyltransferase involved in cell wall biosynthesis
VLPLPYDAVFSTDSEIAGRSGQDGRFNVLTIGHVNPNKRAASVIRAIGSSDSLRSRTRYRLVGPIEPEIREELAALAARLKVDLSISGEVSDAELHRAIEHADVVCSLRWPALEAASASTIEAMLYGKAVLVLDTGFYGELPDAVVRKVAPGRELAGVQRELESLLRDPADRSALGQRAAAWAAVTFRAERYAEALAGLSRTAARTAPAVEASRFFAETLIGWGASVDSPSTTIVGESLGILE